MTPVRPKIKKLTAAQASILHLFERNLSDADLREVNDILTIHFFKKAQVEAEKSLNTKKINLSKTISDLNKNRTITKSKLLNKN